MIDRTIVARATANGVSGIAITRLSGPAAKSIAQKIFPNKTFLDRKATFCTWREDQKVIDQCLVLFFAGPRSATGEDVIEVHNHGNPLLSEMLIKRCVAHGAHPAMPGEFMQKAFLNGKIDLIQAEATADLIEASSEKELRSAAQSLSGVFSDKVKAIQAMLNHVRVQIEAHIDFSDQDISPEELALVDQEVVGIKESLLALLAQAQMGQKLRQGLVVGLVGPANAGKSSLLNWLTKEDTAIVSNIAGTTRDAIKERIHLDGFCITIYDTAGIRESEDVIEKIGIEKTKKVIDSSNHVLIIIDGSQHQAEKEARDLIAGHDIRSYTIVYNKADLFSFSREPKADELFVSVKHGVGLDLLVSRLRELTTQDVVGEDAFIARQRHVVGLQAALNCVSDAEDESVIELKAHNLYAAQQEMNQILGETTTEDLLGMIFSTFCVGK